MVRVPLARSIDVMHLGREHVICAYLVGDLVIDPGPASSVGTLLEELGDVRPRALLLTHIHLDHAGAAGVLVRRFPDLEVYVHERGAPHLADPSRLVRSAGRIYGDRMDMLWGEVAPVPEANIRALAGGERVEGLRVDPVPGHAVHHLSWFHEDTGEAYVGDMGGIRMPGYDCTYAPTPPPDIDIDQWLDSIETIRALRPRALNLTHFGRYEDVDEQLDRVGDWLRRRAVDARDRDLAGFDAALRAEVVAAVGEHDAESYFQAAPPEQLWWGLKRYWEQREAP
jgi:glyoxylase-like metal-dependent hydrolase (beta-lactamase superfamily II)